MGNDNMLTGCGQTCLHGFWSFSCVWNLENTKKRKYMKKLKINKIYKKINK